MEGGQEMNGAWRDGVGMEAEEGRGELQSRERKTVGEEEEELMPETRGDKGFGGTARASVYNCRSLS